MVYGRPKGDNVSETGNNISRRKMLKVSAAAGAMAIAGGTLGTGRSFADEDVPQIPRRVLGKTGATVPILLFGAGVTLDPNFDPKIAEGLRYGLNYVDAADCYNGGTCETSVGNFMTKLGNREDMWITSKSDRHDPRGLEKTLKRGLKKMNTDYFDLYFMHALQEEKYLTGDMGAEMGAMVQKLKDEGKIKYFGFSAHDASCADLMKTASKIEWIDAIMFRYNFRQYGEKELNEAMDACAEAGIGLIAMKTQGSEVSFKDAWQKFQGGDSKWTKHQAVLKAVWADTRIAAAVSSMDTFEKLRQNIAAATDQVELGQADWDALNQYAAETRNLACDGCDHICNAAVDAPVRIGDTMRFLMYHDVYREQDKAKKLFREMPIEAQQIAHIDFSGANKVCPHGLDVAAHMKRSAELFVA